MAEAVLAALVVEAVEEVFAVCVARRSCSIKAREEEERAEMDMRDSFRGGGSHLGNMSAGSRKALAEAWVDRLRDICRCAGGVAYDGRVQFPLFALRHC